MKKVTVVLSLLTLINMAILLSNTALRAQAQQPSMNIISVTTAAGCPTPTNLSVTGSVWQICGAPDAVYVSTVNSPAPAKVTGASSLPVIGTPTAGHIVTWASASSLSDGGPVPSMPSLPNFAAAKLSCASADLSTAAGFTSPSCSIQ